MILVWDKIINTKSDLISPPFTDSRGKIKYEDMRDKKGGEKVILFPPLKIK